MSYSYWKRRNTVSIWTLVVWLTPIGSTTWKTWACFIYVGQVPANEAFKDIIDFDDDGYIKVNSNNQTNIEGIYAAGDIIKKDIYQLLTAMNDGVVSAVNCIKDIKNKYWLKNTSVLFYNWHRKVFLFC